MKPAKENAVEIVGKRTPGCAGMLKTDKGVNIGVYLTSPGKWSFSSDIQPGGTDQTPMPDKR